jgi:hypothetical protein
MNLYKFHTHPETLDGYEAAKTRIPKIAWEAARTPEEKRKLESLWANSTYYAYLYATSVSRKPFPAGEAAIAKDAEYAYKYASEILKRPFPLGEPLIASDDNFCFNYAMYVKKDRFPAGEETIAIADDDESYEYAEVLLKDKNPATWAARYKKKHGLS